MYKLYDWPFYFWVNGPRQKTNYSLFVMIFVSNIFSSIMQYLLDPNVYANHLSSTMKLFEMTANNDILTKQN